MTNHSLPNYLRAHRKQAGLSQAEVAFLLGRVISAQVSRYEKRRRLPSMETAIACEVIFGVPVAQLFADVRDSIEKDIKERRSELTAQLQGKRRTGSAALTLAHKLRWLHGNEVASVVHETSSTA